MKDSGGLPEPVSTPALIRPCAFRKAERRKTAVNRPASYYSSGASYAASASPSSAGSSRRSAGGPQHQHQYHRGGGGSGGGQSLSLDAFLQQQQQDESYQFGPQLAAWQNSSEGFQDRLAANIYSFPQHSAAAGAAAALANHQYPYPASISIDKSSMAPSHHAQPPPHITHHRAGPASASQYSSAAYSYYGGGAGPPSLVDDHSSYPDSSVDTEQGRLASRPRMLDEGPDGVLMLPGNATANVNAAPPGATVYECTFRFLGCRFFTTDDEAAWRTHNLSHFHGNPPPRSVACPLCDFGFESDGGADPYRAWEARMSHLAAHMRLGQTMGTARPDFKLYRYLWSKRIIDDAEYKELSGGATLSAGPRSERRSAPAVTTQGRHVEGRRERVQHYPMHNRVQGYPGYS